MDTFLCRNSLRLTWNDTFPGPLGTNRTVGSSLLFPIEVDLPTTGDLQADVAIVEDSGIRNFNLTGFFLSQGEDGSRNLVLDFQMYSRWPNNLTYATISSLPFTPGGPLTVLHMQGPALEMYTAHMCNYNSKTATLPDFELLLDLGAGAQSKVRLARHRPSGQLYALKAVAKPLRGHPVDRRLSLDYQNALKSIETEVDVLQNLIAMGSRQVPRFVCQFESSTKWFLCLEYIEGEVRPGIERATLLCTLTLIHSRGIAHRDIKPDNIIVRDPNNLADVVLLDFGSAFSGGTHSPDAGLPATIAMRTLCGTPFFLAPEIILG